MSELVTYPQLVIPENAAYKPMQDCSAYEGAMNCGPAASAGAANWALTGSDEPLITHHAFRLKAGNPKDANGRPVGIGTAAAEAALKAYGVTAKRYYGEPINTARAALKAGHVVLCAIHYPFINANFPELSGQLSFKGEHFLALQGWWKGMYRNTKSFDSLYDGRKRSWGKAPLGPQRAPFRAYRGAMEQFKIKVITGGGQVVDTTVREAFGPDHGIFIVVQQPQEVQP